MEQTQIIRKEPQILFKDEEIENVAKAHKISLSAKTKEYLSKGEWTDFIEDIHLDDETLRSGKIQLVRLKDGSIDIKYRLHQEQLVIPSKIGDYSLTDDDKYKLANNQVVGPIKYGGNELYIQVDPDLNSVTVRSDKEINLPNTIGHNTKLKFDGYVLTDQDKNLLMNGGTLPTKLFCGKDGYFTANFSLTDDRKGVVFTNIKSIPNHKVKELEEKLNKPQSKLVSNVIDSANRSIETFQPVTTLENVVHTNNTIINDNVKTHYSIINEITNAKERTEILKSKEVTYRNRDFEVRKMDDTSFALTFSDQDIVYIGTEQECRDKMPIHQKEFDSFLDRETKADYNNSLRIDRSMCKDDKEYFVLSSMLADGSYNSDPSFPTDKIIDSKAFLSMSDEQIKDKFIDKLKCDPSNISFVVIGEGDSKFLKNGSLHESMQDAHTAIQEYKQNELKDHPLVYSIYVVDKSQIREIDSYIGDEPGFREDFKNDLIETTKKEGILVIPDVLTLIEKQDTTTLENVNQSNNAIAEKLSEKITIDKEGITNSIPPTLKDGDELLKAINEVNPVQVKFLVEKGHEILPEHLKALETEQKSVKDQLLGIEYCEDYKQKQKEREEFGPGLDKKGKDLNSIESILQRKSNSNDLKTNPDLSKEFSDAVDKHDFKKLNELSERGWKPSDNEIKGLEEKPNLSSNDKIAIKTIFNMETKPEIANKNEIKNNQGVKFNNDPQKQNNNATNKKVKDVINQAFRDM